MKYLLQLTLELAFPQNRSFSFLFLREVLLQLEGILAKTLKLPQASSSPILSVQQLFQTGRRELLGLTDSIGLVVKYPLLMFEKIFRGNKNQEVRSYSKVIKSKSYG